MKRLMKLVLIIGAVTACTNPVAPSQKFTGDPPVRIDPAPAQSGFQVSHASINHH